ncbi:adenylate cyclase [Burkholderia sp. WAC0059]|uniref:class IV adenylate cyclase n=1 Tax=Burkholderia sp. WAC0059 TaxID=2066022 RepID=UPI000C7EC8FB|nr:class IV adenylate cyclase [Burkholderia sp. WAC0059]PLZ02003.1 adenylate cyclase [Burkholderia sp. WAC0059]
MARNIEIKAHAREFDILRERAARLSPDAPLIFRQQDFFYDVPRGRLKLRQFDDGTPAELIFYLRDDLDGPKASYYTRSPVTNAEAMHSLLATALTTRGIVSKERHVYLAGRTRIHLDRVDGLGDFVELEVLLSPDDDEEGGEAEAHAMFAKLGVDASDLVAVAYVDLLNAAHGPSASKTAEADALARA